MTKRSSRGSPHTPKAGPSQRQLRVGEEIRHALVDIFATGHFRDPDLQNVSITVSEVRPSPDLRNATAFVTPLGGVEVERTVKALNRAASFIRHELAGRVHMKYLPNVSFQADRSFDEATRIDRLLRDDVVVRDLAHDLAHDEDAQDGGSAKAGPGDGA